MDEENNQIVAILNLFGCVEHHLVTHQLRGLNVAIRLKKSIELKWPRLLRAEDKCNHIKYDLNHAINDLEDFESYIDSLLKSGEHISLILRYIEMKSFTWISCIIFH